MKCSGYEIATRETIEIGFDAAIVSVDPVLGETDDVFIAPAFIDLQVNGFAGVDYNSATAAHSQIERSIAAMFSTGVARFFPTVITGSPEDMRAALGNLAEARESIEHGQAMEAFHVEGPHISPEDGPRGAHPARWVRPPDLDEFHRLQDTARGNIRLVTLSPEWPGAPRYIEQITSEGVVASIGHTRASKPQILEAVAAGATLSTHLGNGAHATIPKFPNYIWDQMAEDLLAASFIADGIHLDESFLRVALRAKEIERSILITDSVMPAMCEPGFYQLGEVEVELKPDQRVVLRGGHRLAGSSLRMDRAIENVVRMGVGLRDALTMATINPARVGRLRARSRGLRTGERADIVRFKMRDGRMQVIETFLGGERVWENATPPAP